MITLCFSGKMNFVVGSHLRDMRQPVTVRLELWGALGPFRAGGFAGSPIGLGPAPQLGLKLP